MDKKERLEALIEHYCDGKPSVFAKYIGVAPSTISSWLSRNTIDYDLLFAKCEGVSSRWLLTGEGDILSKNFANCQINRRKFSEKNDNSLDLPKISLEVGQGTPYYDVDFFGGFNEILNSQTTVPTCNIIVPGFEKATLWCNVTGHSMEPKINHGDIVALRQCSVQDIQYGEIYAVVLDTFRTIKILRRGSSSDVLRYVPINPAFDDQEFPVSRILHIFEVLGSIARFF